MNTIEPKLLKELLNADYESLMGFRVRRILMICSNYDAFILEEDGQIETQIYKEYIDLNLSTPPTFVWVQTSAQAREVLNTTVGIDMVICMYNAGDNDVFTLAADIKKERKSLPFVLLTHFSKEVYRRISNRNGKHKSIFLSFWQRESSFRFNRIFSGNNKKWLF